MSSSVASQANRKPLRLDRFWQELARDKYLMPSESCWGDSSARKNSSCITSSAASISPGISLLSLSCNIFGLFGLLEYALGLSCRDHQVKLFTFVIMPVRWLSLRILAWLFIWSLQYHEATRAAPWPHSEVEHPRQVTAKWFSRDPSSNVVITDHQHLGQTRWSKSWRSDPLELQLPWMPELQSRHLVVVYYKPCLRPVHGCWVCGYCKAASQ